MQSQSSVIQLMMNAKNVLNVETKDSNIKFLKSLKDIKQTFRIECTMTRSSEEFVNVTRCDYP